MAKPKGSLTIIYQDGTINTAPMHDIDLITLQKAVGGYIEIVPKFTTYEGEKCVAICDEEGKLKGKPTNMEATRLWHDQCPQAIGIDKLVGAVAIVRGADLLRQL